MSSWERINCDLEFTLTLEIQHANHKEEYYETNCDY